MNMKVRPMTPDERQFSYTLEKEMMHDAGCVGHLRGDMDTDGKGFFTSWNDHTEHLNTDAFKAEINSVVNALRFDEQYGGLLADRRSLSAYCHSHPESAFSDDYKSEFGFRADTDEHTYMIRCNPAKGDYNFYIYAYDREMLEQVLPPVPEKMTVLVVEPGEPPYTKDIDPGLASLQKEVGGYIEAVYPFEEPVALICDEEGKLNGSPLNRALRDNEGHVYDVVAGRFLIAGLSEEDFASLRPEHIRKFSELFKTPEQFILMNGKMMVVPMAVEKRKEKKPSVLQKLNQLKTDERKSEPKKSHTREER